jgi:hypothetical protein
MITIITFGSAGCGAAGPGAVLVEDPYWAPVLAAAGDVDGLLRKVGENTKMTVSRLLLTAQESPAVRLEAFIEKKKPSAVLLGAFIALDLQSLAERYGDILFICLDAPRVFPKNTPYLWVRFDPGPALRQAGETVRRYLESEASGPGEGGSSVAVFLSTDYESLYNTEFLPAVNGPAGDKTAPAGFDTAVFSRGETAESVRSKAAEKIGKNPPLHIVLAGPHNPLILSLIREGRPAPVVLHQRGRITDYPGFPFLASIEKDYITAMTASLAGGAHLKEVIDVPMLCRRD